MGARIRGHDWAATPLGNPATWPQSLRSTLSVCLNSSIVSAIYWGVDFRVLYNDAYAPALAERHPRALGRPLGEVWSEIWDVLGPQLTSVVSTGQGFATDRQRLMMMRHCRLEETFWFYSFAPVRGENGEVAGVFVNAMDITSQVTSERALRESDERQRQIFQQMPGFVGVTTGPEHVYEYVNDAFVRIGGRRDYLGRSVRAVFPEIEGQGYLELLDRVYATGEPFAASAMAARLAGEDEDRFVDLLYQPIRDGAGAVSGIFVSGYDVTERIRAETALRDLNTALANRVEVGARDLRQSEVRANAFFDLAPEYLLLIRIESDRTVRFADINPAAEDVFGRSRAEIVNARLCEVVPEDSAHDIEHYAHACFETGQVQSYRAVRTYQSGQKVHIDARVAPVTHFESGGGLVLFSGRDVTDRIRIEDQLRQSQKMEAVGQLTGGLAHDFNNLLAGISGSLELMQTRMGQGRLNDLDRYMTVAQGAAKRAAALTHRLLAFSRQQTLDPKATDVNRLVVGLEDLIRRTIGPAIEFEVVGAAGLWTR